MAEIRRTVMPPMSASDPSPEPHDGVFHTTRWSMVLRAGGAAQDEAALAQLCQAYWYPLYCCVRRHGHSPEDSQDFTQGFFAKLLRNESFADADPVKGRFRTWLLRSLEHFLRSEHRNASAQKRGGGQALVAWDAQEAEERYALEPTGGDSPEQLFERRWAEALVYGGLVRLRAEFAEDGHGELFDALEPHLWADETAAPYAELSGQLQMKVVALRVTLHRMKRRFSDLLRAEVAATLSEDIDVEEELAHVRRTLAGF